MSAHPKKTEGKSQGWLIWGAKPGPPDPTGACSVPLPGGGVAQFSFRAYPRHDGSVHMGMTAWDDNLLMAARVDDFTDEADVLAGANRAAREVLERAIQTLQDALAALPVPVREADSE